MFNFSLQLLVHLMVHVLDDVDLMVDLMVHFIKLTQFFQLKVPLMVPLMEHWMVILIANLVFD